MIIMFISTCFLFATLFLWKRFWKLNLLFLLIWNQLIIFFLIGTKEIGGRMQETLLLVYVVVGCVIFQVAQNKTKKNKIEIDREI